MEVHLAAAEAFDLDQEGLQAFAEQLTGGMDTVSVRAEVRKDYALKVLAEVAAQKQAFLTGGEGSFLRWAERCKSSSGATSS